MSIAIVTDSTADIPHDLVKTYQIHIMPNIIIMEGQSLVDEVDITREEFYRRLPSMKALPTTATASTGSYIELYEKLFDRGASHIISIHPSGQLSGIINATNAAAQSFPGKVSIVDSQQITMGLGFQVLAAAEMAANGASLEKILKYLTELPDRVRVVAMLEQLEYIHRSGRVSWAKASLGSLLNIKPFVEVKYGKVDPMGEVRTRRKGIVRLVNLLEEMRSIERLAILHTNAEEEAYRLLESVKVETEHPPLVVNVTTIIGTHVGPNCLGYAIVRR